MFGDDTFQGSFFMGVDLGKKHDHSVIALVRKDSKRIRLVLMEHFKLDTAYAAVIGYAKVLCDRFKSVGRISVDQTGLGDYIVEDMKRAGLPNVEGIYLTLPMKQEILGNMKKRGDDGELGLFYDENICSEINVERFELTKGGQYQFSHPEGMHDDRLWALALAVWAARGVVPETIQLGFGRA